MNKNMLRERAMRLLARADRQPGWAADFNARLASNPQRQDAAEGMWAKAQ